MPVTCTETVRFNEIDDHIDISISGPLGPYEFSYTIDETTGYTVGDLSDKFYIKFNFDSSLAGSHVETITLTVLNDTFIEDVDQNYLATEISETTVPFIYIALSEEERRRANQQSSASIASLILTFGASTLIQFIMGGSIEATWLLLGTLQMMSFLPLLNMNLPANFREFSKNLAILHGEPEAFPNIFKYFYDTLDIVKEPFNDYFELMNFNTSYLLLNSGRKVMIWMCIGMFMGVSWLFFDLTAKMGKFGKAVISIDSRIRYRFIIRAISQSYVSLVLSASLNVYTISWSGNVSITSNMIAL